MQDNDGRASRLPVKDARVEREKYGGIEPQDINEWWAPLSRAFLGLLRPLKGARDDIVALMVMQITGITVKRPSGLISLGAGAQWDSQSLQPMPHRVLAGEVWNYDTANPLYLRTQGSQGGIQTGRVYVAPGQGWGFDMNVTPHTVFILEAGPNGVSGAQLVLSGF
jgi:hypothetical protein